MSRPPGSDISDAQSAQKAGAGPPRSSGFEFHSRAPGSSIRAGHPLQRTGSWSTHGTTGPSSHARDTGAMNPSSALPNAPRAPRRTLTGNASDFLHAVDDILATGPTWTAPSGNPPHVMNSFRPDGAPSPRSLIHRSLTMDSFGFDPTVHTRSPLHRAFGGLDLPSASPNLNPRSNEEILSPSLTGTMDWRPTDIDVRNQYSSKRGSARPTDGAFFGPLGGILSSSPDDTSSLHAEASVAIALGDDDAQAPSFAPRVRPDRFDHVSPSSSVDHDLSQRMRSMTMPVELPMHNPLRDRRPGTPKGNMHDSPPMAPRGPGRSIGRGGMPTVYTRYTGTPTYQHQPFSMSPISSPTLPESPDVLGRANDNKSTMQERSISPRGKHRDEGKWFGRPGTLRLGDTVQVGNAALSTHSPVSLDDEGSSHPHQLRHDLLTHEEHDASMRRRGSGRGRGGHQHNAIGHDTGAHSGGRGHRRDAGLTRQHTSAQDESTRLNLAEVRGQLTEISMDQHGSRLIQEKLDHCSQEERTIVFDELYPESRRLMADVFGNYVIQKLLEYGTPAQVQALGSQLEGHVLTLSLGTYGCRVVQKAFERVPEAEKIKLSEELHPYVLDCVRDQNANHVIQKILEQVPHQHLDFIASAFQGHVSTLASHCYSCRVLQRIFAYCSEAQRRPLLDEMHTNTLRLMQDQYGNYVVQWVLQHGDMSDRLAIVHVTKSHLLQLSRHKFASNVVEHVIQVAPAEDLSDLLEELLAPLDTVEAECLPLLFEGSLPLCVATVMMQDQYANYVLQRFLQVLHGHDRERLVHTIRPVLHALRQRQVMLAAQNPNGAPYTGSIRIPGGGHIGSKPLQAIERLIEQVPSSTAPTRTS